MRRLSVFVWLCLALASPAIAGGPYYYFLEVAPFTPPGGPSLKGFFVNWQSNTFLIPPSCGTRTDPAIDLSKQAGFLVTGTPAAGYYPATPGYSWGFCNNEGVDGITADWTSSKATQPDISYYVTFSRKTPPVTTGVFKSVNDEFEYTGGFQNGPRATLTITGTAPAHPVPASYLTVLVAKARLIAGPVTPPAGGPVEALMGWADLNGSLIGQLQTVTLIPGQVASVDLNSDVFIHQSGEHADVLPVVIAPPGKFLPPLEVTIDVTDSQTGFSQLLTRTTGLAPPPSSLSPQGLAGGQIMRLIGTAYAPAPCVATLSFADSKGNPIGKNVQVDLPPGHSQALDLDSSELNLSVGQRIEVQPMVTLQSPVSSDANVVAPACAATVEVFDSITGRTWTYQTADVLHE